MYPLRRLIIVTTKALLSRKKISIYDESVINFRVLPQDLDTNFHMNNGRYNTLMDIGRFDLIFRAGVLPVLIKKKWTPVVASSHVLFRRSLDPFQKFKLHTRLVYFDEKWFYIQQKFIRNNTVVAIGAIKGVFKCPKGHVNPAELAQINKEDVRALEKPDFVKFFDQLDGEIRK